MKIIHGKTKKNITRIVINHFNELSENYDEKSYKRNKYIDAINNEILNNLVNIKNTKILDIGCGTGSRTKKILNKLESYNYYGCDISTEMIKKAKENGLKNIKYGDVTNLPYGNGEFDVVLCLFNVLGYVHDKNDLDKAFSEIARVAHKNSVILIDVMNQQHIGEGLEYHKNQVSHFLTFIKSVFTFGKTYGQLFYIEHNNDKLQGYVRGFKEKELTKVILRNNMQINNIKVVGYDTGTIYQEKRKGQLFFNLSKMN